MNVSFDPRDLATLPQDQYDALLNLIKVFRAGGGEEGTPQQEPERTSEQLELVVQQMLTYANHASHLTEEFSVPEVYEGALKMKWEILHPTERKRIGRQFRKAVDNYEPADSETVCVMYHGRTQQNQSLYLRVALSEKVK